MIQTLKNATNQKLGEGTRSKNHKHYPQMRISTMQQLNNSKVQQLKKNKS